MNSPTATLYFFLLSTFLPFFFFSLFQYGSVSLVFFSVPVSIAVSLLLLPLCLPLSLFSLSDVYSYPSAPDCESALLWQFCCRALLTCMSCCIAMSSHHSKVLRVRAVLPQQRGNAERMLHRRCGQDYLKNLLRLILFFLIISAHAAPHNDSLQNIDSSHICLIILCCQCWAFLIFSTWS